MCVSISNLKWMQEVMAWWWWLMFPSLSNCQYCTAVLVKQWHAML